MTTTSVILGNIVAGQPLGNYDGVSQDWASDHQMAADYYQGRGGLQTVTFDVTNFVGRMVLEATLDADGNHATWFETAIYQSAVARTDRYSVTVSGNFTWMRVRVALFDSGSIDSVTITY